MRGRADGEAAARAARRRRRREPGSREVARRLSAEPPSGADRVARWKLAEALAAVCDTPATAAIATRALGLGDTTGEAHTRVFVLDCPPYASVHLGPEGHLGGEATERVAGFWRTVGATPPAEPDHLASLLVLYASLGRAADAAIDPAARAGLDHARLALVWEHLWTWVPGYAAAVEGLPVPLFADWARLVRRVLAADLPAARRAGGDRLPLALREAPPPLDGAPTRAELLDALVAPVRSGIVLTRHQLDVACADLGIGRRIGERRYTLAAMLDQDPDATLAWLTRHTRQWRRRHRQAGDDLVSRWWAARAARTARFLATPSGSEGSFGPVGRWPDVSCWPPTGCSASAG